MGLTTRPTRKTDLAKIDEIQKEYFEAETAPNEEKIEGEKEKIIKEGKFAQKMSPEVSISSRETSETAEESVSESVNQESERLSGLAERVKTATVGAPTIADLLATTQSGAVRYSSRPYTVPRSLTIDLNRLKAKFKMRELHYTQNELMDQMVREALNLVTAENYQPLREKAARFVKSPEQSSRRTVTLTEETVGEMAELKAALTLNQNRRVSSDELFTALLTIAFMPLYEKGLL